MSNLKKIFGSTSLTMFLFAIRCNHCLPIDQQNLTYPNGELINTLIYTNFPRKYVNDQDYPEKKIYKISQACLTLTRKEGQCKLINECIHNNMHFNLNQFLNYTCIFNSTELGICCSNESPSSSSLSLVDSLVVPLPAVASFYTENGNNPDSEERRKGRGHRGCGTNIKSGTRLVGGRPADPREWPWMAALLRKDAVQYCGGVLITDRHILTAAHCVRNFKTRDIRVRLGEYDFTRTDETRELDFAVVEIRVHRDFDSTTYENDIAIIKIHRPTPFNSYIWPICLPPIDQTFENKTAFVTGWGSQYYGGPSSTVLMEVAVPIWPQEMCTRSFSQRVTRATMCAGAYEGGRDACQGDSGGPLVHQLGNGRWVNIGIVSWGIRCGEPNNPGIYTRVNFYLDWIFANAVF
ncbi:hypothetical protein M0804_000219 [Polistes exclamans]|nr:hypothetical protein M0804_000219 [Polistes exclamans]